MAITHDRRIRYKPNELAAVLRHRVRLLVVVGKAPLADLAQNFVRCAPRILALLGRHEAPLIAKVYRPSPSELREDARAIGSVTLWSRQR